MLSATSQQASITCALGNPAQTTPDNAHATAWFPRDIPVAPDGTLHMTLPPHPNRESDDSKTSNAVTNKSNEVLGGITHGSGHQNSAQSLNPVDPLDFNIRTDNLKSSKFVGVTFRPNRVKYQARIYKGNKEFNLGLFDLSADAALAYDVTHRLMAEVERVVQKELDEKNTEEVSDKPPLRLSSMLDSAEPSSTTRIDRELSKLNELEKNPSLTSQAFTWLEESPSDFEASDALRVKECERLNFRHPREYYAARQKEAEDKKWTPSEDGKEDAFKKKKERKSTASCQGKSPSFADLKVLIRKDAIRVAKAVLLHGGGLPVGGEKAGKKKRRKTEHRHPLSRKGKSSKRKSQHVASASNSPPDDELPAFSAVPSLPAMANAPVDSCNPNVTLTTNSGECKSNEDYTNAGTTNSSLNAREINPLVPHGMAPLAKEETVLSSGPIDASNGIANGQIGRATLSEIHGSDMMTTTNGIGMSGMDMGSMNAMTMHGIGLNGMNAVGMNGMVMSGMGSVGVNNTNGMGINCWHSIGMNGMMNGMNSVGLNGLGMSNRAILGIHSLNGMGMNGMNAGMGMHDANSLGMNSMDQILMAQSRAQNRLCPTACEINDINQANFVLNGMEACQNFNSVLNLQRNMNSYPLTTGDFMNAAMDGSLRGLSSLGGMVSGAGGEMVSNPYGHLGGNFNMNVNGNLSGEGTMMGNGATAGLPSHNVMMMGAASTMEEQYANSVAGMNCQMMLMQQRQQQLHQQGPDGINSHLNDFELNTMGDMAAGISLLNKNGLINLGIENMNNKFSGSLNPYQNNFYAGPFSGVRFYPTGGTMGNVLDQPVPGEVGSLIGSSPMFCSNNDKNGSYDV